MNKGIEPWTTYTYKDGARRYFQRPGMLHAYNPENYENFEELQLADGKLTLPQGKHLKLALTSEEVRAYRDGEEALRQVQWLEITSFLSFGSDSCLNDLPHLPNLRILTVQHGHYGEKLLREAARKFPNLMSLKISGTRINNDCVQLIADQLPQLERLELWGGDVTPCGYAFLKHIKKLNWLQVKCRTSINDDCLKEIGQCKALRYFSLIHEPWITDKGMLYLAALTEMVGLRLIECSGITDACAPTFASMTKLEELNFARSNVSDAVMESLAGKAQIRMLWLHSTEVTDAGLAKLGLLPNLTELCVENTKVTESGILNCLPNFPKLKKWWFYDDI